MSNDGKNGNINEHMQLLNVFLTIHNKKAKVTKEPVAYLMEKGDCLNRNSPLVAWKEEHLKNYFDHDSITFSWLMKQFKSYDFEKEVLMGIIIDKQTILSEVLKK